MQPPNQPGDLPLPGRGAERVLNQSCLILGTVKIAASVLVWIVPLHAAGWLAGPGWAAAAAAWPLCIYTLATGLLAISVHRTPAVARLVVGVVIQGGFVVFAFPLAISGPIDVATGWPVIGLVVVEGAATLLFWLYLIRQLRPDLMALNAGAIRPSLDRPRTRHALLVYFSLSGNGGRAIEKVHEGLRDGGYRCSKCFVTPSESRRFACPFRSFGQFLGIVFDALLRRSVAVKWQIEPCARSSEVGRSGPDDFDLVVCLSQTWMLGISTPIQGLFDDPAGAELFAGRDVALVNVCRGLWRRSQAQLCRGVEDWGGHVVAASPHENPGREPFRLFSLFLFLALGPERWPLPRPGNPAENGAAESMPSVPAGLSAGRWLLTPQFLDSESLAELSRFGRRLTERPGHDEPSRPGEGN